MKGGKILPISSGGTRRSHWEWTDEELEAKGFIQCAGWTCKRFFLPKQEGCLLVTFYKGRMNMRDELGKKVGLCPQCMGKAAGRNFLRSKKDAEEYRKKFPVLKRPSLIREKDEGMLECPCRRFFSSSLTSLFQHIMKDHLKEPYYVSWIEVVRQ